MTIQTKEFKKALSSFATGITIITTCDKDGNSIGMTASSFNSVSMEPPLILWSVTKTAFSADIFKDAENFSVHILSTEHTELSNNFATSGADKFSKISYNLDQNNVPIISDISTRFDCKTWEVHEGGDHWIIIGEVQKCICDESEGLIFVNGAYASAHKIKQ